MFYLYLRYTLITMFLVLGTWFQIKFGFEASGYLFGSAFLLGLTHLLLGGVNQALVALQKGKIKESERILTQVWSLRCLLPLHKKYYFLCRGLLALHHKNAKEGAIQLEKAVSGKKLKKSALGLALLNLAHAYYFDGQVAKVEAILYEIEALKLNNLKIKEGVGVLRESLKSKQR